MSNLPSNLKYTKNHEWIRLENDNEATIGITDYAQESLGDITFVELPDVGTQLVKDESFGVVESVKAASDVYMPVSGEIIAVNETLDTEPETVNTNPYDAGWLIKVQVSDKAQLDALMSDQDYEQII